MHYPVITPQYAAHTLAEDRPDAALPALATAWIAAGHDSPDVRALASLPTDRAPDEARSLFLVALTSLGHPPVHLWDLYDESRDWCGLWDEIEVARGQLDAGLNPFFVTTRILKILHTGDPDRTWAAGGGPLLLRLARAWRDAPDDDARASVEARMAATVRGLRRDQVPPRR